MSLFKISKYILVPILSEWLIVEEIVNLDTSLTNTLARKVFLGDLASFAKLFQANVFSDVLAFPLSLSLLKWMTSRGLNVEGMTTISINNATLAEFSAQTTQSTILSYVLPWKRSSISSHNQQVEKTQAIFFVYLKTVQCLKMGQISFANKGALSCLLQHCSSLQELHICNPHVTIMDCVEMHCRNLKICNFSGCHVVEESSLVTICRNCPQITDLHLYHCRSVAALLFHCLIVHCSHLQTLDVRGCNMISKLSVLQFAFHLRKPLRHFRYVNYTGLSLRTFMHYRGCHLEGIEVSQHYIAFLSLVDLTVVCPNLTHLDLFNNVYVSDQDIAHLTASLPQLERLTINKLDSVTSASLNSIVFNCHHLKELNICYTHKILNITNISIHPQFATLERLSLRGMALTDFVLTGILAHCGSSLLSLDISHNIDLTNETFVACAVFLSRLGHLTMIRLDKITHKALYAIAYNCSQLIELNIEGCTLITDFALLPVLDQCKRLTKLDASQCELLTIDTLNAIAANCTRLSHLILREFKWDAISAARIPHLLDQCRKLTQFETNHVIPQYLWKKHPNLENHFPDR